MARLSCPVCGDAAVIEYDSSAGNVVCTTCGFVVDENTIVSDVTFGESSTGAAVLQGSSLGATDLRARIVGPRGRPQVSAESRTQTLENGMHKLLAMARGLNLSDAIAESAHRFFTLAVSNGFVMGRRSPYVLASCIYVACRMNKLPTMLIDISDFLQVNVFIVGATYLKLVKELCLHQIPLIDPSLYISRFAALLEFGTETEKVAYDATRLVQRFDHDWITTGRRPSGIAGACLLIAARMNNFKRSVLEIVQVVKIADVTIKERLKEFKTSQAGKMTIESFRNQWLEASENPPAFERGRKRKKKPTQKAAKRTKTGDSQGEEEEEQETEQKSDEEGSSRATFVAPSPTIIQNSNNQPPILTTVTLKAKDPGEDDESEIEEQIFDPEIEETDRWYENQIDCVITQDVEAHLTSGTGSRLQNELDNQEMSRKKNQEKEDLLDDLNEEELDSFILGDQEVEMKTRVWMELNREYLEKLAEKKEREASGEIRPTKKYTSRPKAKPRDSDNPAGATVGESVLNMMTSKKKLSSKINYAIADSLFGSTIKGNSKHADSPNSVPTKEVSQKAKANPKHFHSSLLNNAQNQQQEEDDDDEEEEQEEEGIIMQGEEIEFAMLKRGTMVRDDDDDDGWGEV